MRISLEGRNVLLLMRDGKYFEIECPSYERASDLKALLELGIADTIEQIQVEEVRFG